MQAAENSTWPAGPVELGADGTVVVGPGWAGDDAYWLSADAGRSGSMRRLPALALTGISAIAFRDREHGLALGGLTLGGGDGCAEATMLATSDGGAIWHHQGSLGMTVVSVAYNGSLAVAAGSACNISSIAISTNSGQTWSVVSTGGPRGPVWVYLWSVAMVCAHLMPGRQYLLLSHDGGAHWLPAGEGPASANYQEVSSVVVTAASALWASGPPGALWRTTDGGWQWSALPLMLPLVA